MPTTRMGAESGREDISRRVLVRGVKPTLELWEGPAKGEAWPEDCKDLARFWNLRGD